MVINGGPAMSQLSTMLPSSSVGSFRGEHCSHSGKVFAPHSFTTGATFSKKAGVRVSRGQEELSTKGFSSVRRTAVRTWAEQGITESAQDVSLAEATDRTEQLSSESGPANAGTLMQRPTLPPAREGGLEDAIEVAGELSHSDAGYEPAVQTQRLQQSIGLEPLSADGSNVGRNVTNERSRRALSTKEEYGDTPPSPSEPPETLNSPSELSDSASSQDGFDKPQSKTNDSEQSLNGSGNQPKEVKLVNRMSRPRGQELARSMAIRLLKQQKESVDAVVAEEMEKLNSAIVWDMVSATRSAVSNLYAHCPNPKFLNHAETITPTL